VLVPGRAEGQACPGANTCEVNVRRETGKFKLVIFLQIHAAGDSNFSGNVQSLVSG
jgi:hypothetical protein